MDNQFNKFLSSLQVDGNDRVNTINLNASENFTSQSVKKVIGSHPAYDCYHFAPLGGMKNDHWSFIETSFTEKMRLHLENISKEFFGTPLIDPRPKGGQIAEISVLLGVAGRGDTVFYVGEEDGGHFGLSQMAKIAGIRLEPIVFYHTSHLIDIDSTIMKMWDVSSRSPLGENRNKPKALIISQSFVLRRQHIQELCSKVRNAFPDIIITWDASHTLGLVIGKEYPHPLDKGVDILHANTHKTFPGPQKAIVVFSEHLQEKVRNQVSTIIAPVIQSNCGTSEIFALAIAFEEMRQHGRKYAEQVCKNAKELAFSLQKEGFSVIGENFGFTETHQVWFCLSDKENTLESFKLLHKAGIRGNPVMLPFTGGRWGFRIGTAAMTRRGMEETEMREIARFFRKVIIDKVEPLKIRKETKEFMNAFPLSELAFVLDPSEVFEIQVVG